MAGETKADAVSVTMSGGQVQGVAGAGSVVIENFTIYNRAPDTAEPAATDDHPIGPCPYPGLAYFGPNGSALFFGRDAAIDRLVAAVSSRSFTALVGSSGSGKSSVVLAGLAPRLHAMGGWRFAHFRIGNELDYDPFLALSRALVPLFTATADEVERLANTRKLADHLRSGDLTLRDVFADSRGQAKGSRVLLIADQFEESFTLIKNEAVRHRFVDVLLAGFPDPVDGAQPEISLILTMRADFYGRALLYRPLADALQGHVENLGPMSADELRLAIVQPAANAGVSFEPGLVETLLDDVESKPGSLPLLQFALREMWGLQEKRTITHRAYETIGGVQGALARRAEAIFVAMTANGSDARIESDFQRLFTRLVTPGEGQEDTRRVADRRELGDGVWSLAQRLADEANRLVVTSSRGPAHETAEVVHEALIRNWPTLAGWINRDRTFLSWLRQIRTTMDLWLANTADEGPLLRGGMLAQAREWLSRRGEELSPDERRYIEASVAARDRDEAEREASRQAEIRSQRDLAEAASRLAREQGRRAKVAVAGVIVALLLAAFGTFGWYVADANEKVAIEQARLAATSEAKAKEQAEEARRQADLAATNEKAAKEQADRADAAAKEAEEQQRIAQEQGRKATQEAKSALRSRTLMLAGLSMRETDAGRPERGLLLALVLDPGRMTRNNFGLISRDDVPLLSVALERAIYASPELRAFNGHTEAVNSAALSPDGKHVVTASTDKTARLWDAASGKELRALSGHTGDVVSAAFSPDGRRVVTASADKTARLWDVESGKELRAFSGHAEAINCAAFSPDGTRIVTASWDNSARLWDATSGRELRAFSGHTGGVFSAAFSPDGTRVVTASWDMTARMWDVATGRELRAFSGHTGEVNSAAFSPVGSRVVTASEDKTARLWDTESGQELRSFSGHAEALTSAAFSPDGNRVLTASNDKIARLWDVATGRELRAFGGHVDRLFGAAFSHDGTRIVTASRDKSARLWDAESGGELRTFSGHAAGVFSAAFSHDGTRIVTASRDDTARLWDAESGRELRLFNGHADAVASAAFSPNGTRIVTASWDDTARLWDVATGRELRAFRGHAKGVASAAFSPDGSRIVTAAGDRTARLWDTESGRELHAFTGHAEAVVSAAFSPDGSRVVTASTDKTARLWDTNSGRELRAFSGHAEPVISAAFSPDGTRIVTASADKTARLWDTDSGRELRAFSGHAMGVTNVAFSPDGTHIMTTSADKTARLWDADSGGEVRVFSGHAREVISVAFSPEGTRVVTASADRTARLWGLLPSRDDLWKRAAALKKRNLTEAERREFFLVD